jgi:hypothetical protein
MSLPTPVLAGLILVVAACASTTQDRTAQSRTVITAEELATVAGSDLFDAIRRLRPEYLRVRRQTTLMAGDADIRVYVDGVRYGGVAELRSISVRSVAEVHFIDAREATIRWGTGHSLGVIHVISRTR